MNVSYKVLNHIYKRKVLLQPVLSVLPGVVTKIVSDSYGFRIVVDNDAGEIHEYLNIQVLNVILDESIRDGHLIGYVLKGKA